MAEVLRPDDAIFVTGHRGMVGSAIVRCLEQQGFSNIVTRTRAEADLVDQGAVRHLFNTEAIDHVVVGAARVGGIHANNTYPAEFIYDNLMVEANLIHEAWRAGVKRLLFLGSSCIYPRLAPQPMREEALLAGHLEPTNEPYAVAKIAGIKLCESYNRQHGVHFRSLMPTNLYGPGDNFHPENSHVIPALLRRFHEAKARGDRQVVIWGSGTPTREFLHVDDLARAAVFIMGLEDAVHDRAVTPMMSHINVGTGQETSIFDLAHLVKKVVGFTGEIVFDPSRPDGTPRKVLEVGKINALGWRAEIGLESGLRDAYQWFLQALADGTAKL